MKLFVRLIKILFISALASAAGAGLSYYYLHFRLTADVSLQALAWEPFVVIACLWLIVTLLTIYFVSRKKDEVKSLAESATAPLQMLKQDKPDTNMVANETLSDAALSDLKKDHTSVPARKIEPVKEEVESKAISDEAKVVSEDVQAEGVKVADSSGIIKWFNGQKGYGFITSEQGEEVFVHCRSIKSGGKRQLHTGQQVNFTLIRENKGLKADDVVIVE